MKITATTLHCMNTQVSATAVSVAPVLLSCANKELQKFPLCRHCEFLLNQPHMTYEAMGETYVCCERRYKGQWVSKSKLYCDYSKWEREMINALTYVHVLALCEGSGDKECMSDVRHIIRVYVRISACVNALVHIWSTAFNWLMYVHCTLVYTYGRAGVQRCIHINTSIGEPVMRACLMCMWTNRL